MWNRPGKGAAMNPKMKSALSIGFIVVSIAAVIVIAFSNQELGDAWAAISRLNIGWVAGIALCWWVYTFFESFSTWLYLRGQGYRIAVLRMLAITLLGFFYSNITPSAAGGQPMQVNAMRKAGIPVAFGTMAVTIRLIANQMVISIMSLVLLVMNLTFVRNQLNGFMWVVLIGWLINFAVVPLVLMAGFMRKGMQRLAGWVISLGVRLHLVKNRESAENYLMTTLDTYQNAMREMVRSPGRILLQLGGSLISLLGLTGSIIFVYHAFGMSGTPWYRLLTLSCLLFISASYTPLPGASGAQEGGFLVYFQGIFTDGVIGLALLTWRFFTYYLFLLTGVIMVVWEKLLTRKTKRTA